MMLALVTVMMIASPFSISIQTIPFFVPDLVHAAQAQCDGVNLVTRSQNPGLFNGIDSSATYACTDPNSPTTLYYNENWDQVGSNNSQTGQVGDKNGKLTISPTSCANILVSMSSPFTCMFRTLVSLTAAALISISTWILTIAGELFNWLVGHTILRFGDLYGVVKSGVETAWTAFRDIANIVIIGIFTFVAISIILGAGQFGQKKMIAKVLVVAVFINFSLLITKMIIDASNFTANQLYTAAALGAEAGAANIAAPSTDLTKGDASVASAGISGQFINLLGVGTFANAYTAVNSIAEAKDSGWVALLHGLFVMVILLGAAFVLFYGSFLLVSRAILLIFLLVTASIAFASYLVPAWENSRYGWNTWWSSLLKCAAFAPILMLFLWMTLTVSTALQRTSHGTFGDMIANPSSAPDINTLFVYILILGLLYASFKLSSKFSSKIGGLDYISGALKLAVGAPLALASRFAVAPILRNTVGRRSAIRGMELEEAIEVQRIRAAQATDANKPLEMKELSKLMRKKGRAEARAKSTFDLMNTAPVQAVGKAVGLPGTFTKQTKTSFDESAKATADKSAKEAAAAAISKDDARKALKEQRRENIETRNVEKENAERIVGETRRAADRTIQNEGLAQKHADAKRAEQTIVEDATRVQAQAVDDHKNGNISTADRDSVLSREKDRIDKASVAVKTIQSRIDAINVPFVEAEKVLKEKNDEIAKLNKQIESDVTVLVEKGAENAREAGAAYAHKRFSNILPRILGEQPEDDYTSRLARGLTKKKIKVKEVQILAEAQRASLSGANIVEPGGGEAGAANQ